MRSLPLSRLWLLLLVAIILAACGQTEPPAATPGQKGEAQPTALPTQAATVEPVPVVAATGLPTRPILEPVPLSYATPDASPVANWGPPPYPAPLALRPNDHFYLERPLASDADTWLHPVYRYGNTHFNEESTHTGVDIVTSMRTPVLASADGVVIWAGYGLYRGYEDETDPYGLAVAIDHGFGYDGQKIYTLYSHLTSIDVIKGQPVEAGQVIGRVGNTGEATGPHLHFEVRLGQNGYFHSYNPELWMVPLEGTGVLAGRIYNSWGRPLEEYPIHIYNLETKIKTEVWTYAGNTVNADPFYQENVVVGDLPAGPYEVYINYVGRKFSAQLYLWPGQTNLITFNGRDGFEIEP